MRDNATLQAIFNNNYNYAYEELNNVLYYYCETSSMDGVRSIFRRLAFIDIIEYYYTNEIFKENF